MAVMIGEFMVNIGALTKGQVQEILRAQKEGDGRLFGEIAVSRGVLEESALERFVNFLAGHQEITI
jgi:hypothetical protein